VITLTRKQRMAWINSLMLNASLLILILSVMYALTVGKSV
jgi:hypothetical protein